MNPRTHYPCGKRKTLAPGQTGPQLKDNLAHYRACSNEKCKARLVAHVEIRGILIKVKR